MNTSIPLYLKLSLFFVGIYFFVAILFQAQTIIVPLIFGAVIAIVLQPIVSLLEKWKLSRLMSIIIALLLALVAIAFLGLFLFSQMSRFAESWPIFVEKFSTILNQTMHWIPRYFDIDAHKLNDWITDTKVNMLANSGTFVGQAIIDLANGFVVVMLVAVYIFVILYYQPLLLDFIYKLFEKEKHSKVQSIIVETKVVIQHYLVGLLIEALIVGTLNAIGLIALGIEYAVLIGILGALLNLIPYIGGVVAVTLPMMVALATKSSPIFALYVLALYAVIQLIDNNYIIPKIVASKVRINALVSILVVLAGGALWGFAGMFLSIPLIAIVKVVCDHIEPLQPLGFLLGDTMPQIGVFKIKKK